MLKETPKAAAAYAAYEGMGPERSLDKLAKLWGKSKAYVGQLERWSAQLGWVARAQAFDLAALERERLAQQKAQDAAAKRKAEREARRALDRERMDDDRAPLMQAEWKKTLVAINQRMDAGELYGMSGLVALLKHTMDEERMARGGATIIQEQRLGGPHGESLSLFDTHSMLTNTEAIHAANALLEAIAGRGDESSGVGLDGQQASLAASPPSVPVE